MCGSFIIGFLLISTVVSLIVAIILTSSNAGNIFLSWAASQMISWCLQILFIVILVRYRVKSVITQRSGPSDSGARRYSTVGMGQIEKYQQSIQLETPAAIVPVSKHSIMNPDDDDEVENAELDGAEDIELDVNSNEDDENSN
jgi:hypothetical protein